MTKKTYILIFIILLFVFGAYVGKQGFWDNKSVEYSNMTRDPYVRPQKIKVTLIISFSENETKKFETEADKGDSVFNLLRTVVAKENIELEGKEYDFGTMVESIGGVKNSPTNSWIYFVNEASGDVAANQKMFNAEDIVEWKYIKPVF